MDDYPSVILAIITFIWNDYAWILLSLVTVVLGVLLTCYLLDSYNLFGYRDKPRKYKVSCSVL